MKKTTLRPSVLAALLALFFFAVPIRAQVNDTVEWNALTIADSGVYKWTPSAGSDWVLTPGQFYANYDSTIDNRIRSPWVRIPASAVHDSLMLICNGYKSGGNNPEYSICVTSDGIHYDTLLRNFCSYNLYDTLYVGTYAGQTVQFEICHYGLTRTAPFELRFPEYCMLIIYDVFLEPTTLPKVTLPQIAYGRVGDTMAVAAQYASGSRTGLAYTWHSSLMDTTWTTSGATGNDTAKWVYTLAGTDTLTVTATNAFGSDTAWMVYEVYDCSGAASLPWHVDLSEGGFACIRPLPSNGWGRAVYDGESCLHAFNQSNGAVVLPPVILPADTVPIHVEWKDARMFGNLTYNLLISTTGWDDLAAFDTVGTFVATSSAWASRSADIGAYAGQTVWLAFSCTGTGQGVNIADISVMSDRTPVIASLSASATMLPVGDTAVYNVTLSHGDTSGLTYRWHSSLMNQVHVGGDQWAFVYDRAGVDTISVVPNNPWGADSARVVVDVQDCRVVSSFPWSEDFSHPRNAYTVCWTIDGWRRVTDVVGGGQLRFVMMADAKKKHMLSQPIAIPATGVEHLSLWVEVAGSLVVKVDTSASTDTANYTDTLLVTSNSRATYLWHTANLSSYAGRTVRLGFFRYGSLSPYIGEVKVDYDTLPVVGPVSAPAVGVVDSTIVCTANLRFGATSGLTYKWTSTLMDTSWMDTSQSHTSSFELRYTRAGMDTITVVATNSFGSDTSAPCIVNVIDCHPATTLPWSEDFQNGIVCWYKPQGSKFVDAIPHNDPAREHQRHLYLNTQRDTMGSWLISKEIRLPAYPNLSPTLFWNVASSYAAYRHLYSVLVTDSADYTDTANYTILYTDNSSHRQFSNYDRLSIDLSRYAGRSIHIAFHNHGNHLAPLSIGLYIDDIEISLTSTPVVSLSLPAEVYAFDSLAYTCTLHEGANLGMTYTWHSTLLDSTIVSASPTLPIVYTMAGTDTISVVAANAYGSDTATAVVTVVSCYIADYPWLEDFIITGTYSYNTSGGKIPQCWTRYWTGSNPVYAPHIVTTYLSGSIRTRLTHSSALLLTAGSDPGYAAESIVETPIFTGQLNDKVVSFFYMQENATKGILTVGYMQDDIFVPVCDMPQQQSGRETVRLGNLPSGVNRVAFRWTYSGNSWYGVIIDSVQVLEVDSIPSVRINAPTIAYVGDSAVFRAALVNGRTDSLGYTWHSSLLDSTITTVDPFVSIVYSTTGVDTIALVATNAYGSDTVTATLSVGSHPLPQISLTAPAQVFTGDSLAIRVSLNNCSRNGLTLTWKSTLMDSTWATTAPVAFNGVYEFEGVDTITVIAANAYGADTAEVIITVIECRIVSLPWFEDFQGNNPLQCWTHLGAGSISRPHESYYAPFCHSGSRGLRITNYDNNVNTAYAVSPLVMAPGNELLVSFWANHLETGGMVLQAGVLTVPGDTSSFIPRITCPLTSTPTRFEFDTRGFTSNPLSVAFRMIGRTNGLIIDDINIEQLTPCARLRSVSSYSVDARTAVVEWQYDTASAIPNTGALVVLVDLSDTNAAPRTATASGSSYSFSALTPGHRYQATVQALCGADTAEALTTAVVPSGNPCDQRRGSFSSNWAVINCDRPYSYSQTLYPAVLAASVDTLFGLAYHITSTGGPSYHSSYDTYSTGPRLLDVYIGQTASDTLSAPVSVASHTLAVQNYELSVADTGWVHINFTNPVPLDGVGNLIVTVDDNTGAIYGNVKFSHHAEAGSIRYHTSSANYNYTQTYDPYNPTSFTANSASQIPDIQLLGGCSSLRCLQPIVAVAAEDTHSINIAWQQRGAESLWQVEYHVEGDSLWHVADTTSSTAFTLSGLNASTGYRVRVVTLCGDRSIPSAELRAHTLCGTVDLPYHQTFRATWMPASVGSETGVIPCWQTGDIYILSQGRGLWNTNQNGDYIISPEMGANPSMVRVDLTASGSTFFLAGLKVGVCNSDGGNLTWLDTITLSDQAEVYTVYLSAYEGTSRHIAIGGVYGSWTLYDVKLSLITECQPVHHLTLGSISASSATIHWPPVDTASSWALYLNDSLVGTTHDTSFTFANLQPATDYTLGVREICWPGDTAATTTLAISTMCTASLPWTDDFEDGTHGAPPACWYQVVRPRIGTSNNVGLVVNSSAGKEFRLYDSYSSFQTDTVANFICSPMLIVGSNAVNVSFTVGEFPHGDIQAGIITNPADPSTFIPMASIANTSSQYSFSTAGMTLPASFSVALRTWGYCAANVDNFVVDYVEVPTYTLTLAASDTTMGTVSGAGTYERGTAVTVAATPTLGHHFVTWSDSVTSPVREFVITENLSLTAYFAPDTTPVAPPDTVWHTVSVVAVMADGSPVTWLDEPVSGAGTYADGDTVILQGQVNGCGTSLVYWLTATGDTVYDNPYTFVIHSDVSLTAVFREDGGIDSDLQPPTSDITLHPNPATSSVTLSGLQPGMLLTLLDLNGRQLQEFRIQDSELKIDVSSLPAGTYFLRLSSPSATTVRRLVKR